MNETGIEKRLVDGVKKLGGMCLKFTSPSMVGVPDRIIITNTGKIIFVELKTIKGRASAMQKYIIGEMRKRGANVRLVKGLDEVNALLAEIKGGDTE